MNHSATIHSRRGQTLVEALVAISILTTGFVGIVALLNKSFQLNRTTTNDTQATYLASEGIEITKNLIDHDIYSGLPGNDYFGQSFPSTGHYYGIDFRTTTTAGLTVSNATNTTPLYYDSNNHLFSYDSSAGTQTKFVRDIWVGRSSDGYELDVRSTVTWSDAASSNSITLEDHFYDWHPL